MTDEKKSEKIFDLFGKIFLLSLKLEKIVDQELAKDHLTTKQFLFLVAIDKLFDRPPSLKEVANVLNTSHQNAKQIAILLERKGFVVMEEDPEDRRVVRLKVTEKNRLYWESTALEHERFLLGLFSPFSEEDINVFDSYFDRLLSSLTLNHMK